MFKNRFRKKNNSRIYEEIHYSCTIRFLDDSDPISISFQKDTDGQWLLQYVCKQLNLIERDYFGLRFVDADRQRHWLDPYKTVSRQLKNVTPLVLCFRVKFYPTDPLKLKEEITRYFLFLQLRRDLHHGRLLCSPSDANLLAAYIVQAELGDYEDQNYAPCNNDSASDVRTKDGSETASSTYAYVGQLKMLSKQTRKQEEQIADIHKTLMGQVPSIAEENFLKKASQLDTYGIDPHPVKQQKGTDMYLGVTHLGIVTYHGSKRTNLFKWCNITRLAFEGKMFIVHITLQQKKHACGFKCSSYQACKHLWKCANEQKYFFTLQNSDNVPKVISGGGFFSRGAKFRFSGRCQNEVYLDSSRINRKGPMFARQNSNASLPHSMISHSTTLPIMLHDPAGTSTEIGGGAGAMSMINMVSAVIESSNNSRGGPVMAELCTPTYSEETIAEVEENEQDDDDEVPICESMSPIPAIVVNGATSTPPPPPQSSYRERGVDVELNYTVAAPSTSSTTTAAVEDVNSPELPAVSASSSDVDVTGVVMRSHAWKPPQPGSVTNSPTNGGDLYNHGDNIEIASLNKVADIQNKMMNGNVTTLKPNETVGLSSHKKHLLLIGASAIAVVAVAMLASDWPTQLASTVVGVSQSLSREALSYCSAWFR